MSDDIFEQARQLAEKQLTSSDSQPVRVSLNDFWKQFTQLSGFDQIDRQKLLDAVEAVFLDSGQFILCKWVREAAISILKKQSNGMAVNALWESLTSQELLPKHPTHRTKLLETINAVFIGNDRIILLSFIEEAIESVLLEVKTTGMQISEIRTYLESRQMLPVGTNTVRSILDTKAFRVKQRYYHPNHKPPIDEKQAAVGSKDDLSPGQKTALALLSGDDPSTVVFLDMDEFLLALMEASVSVPDNVSSGDKPGATYSFLNGMGVVEVDSSKVVLLVHVIREFERILLKAGTDGISKDAMWQKLREASLQPAYRIAKAQLPRKPFAVIRDDVYYHKQFAPALPEPELDPDPVPALIQQKLEIAAEPELVPLAELETDQPLSEDQPLDDHDGASLNLAGLAGQMLQNLTPQMMAAMG